MIIYSQPYLLTFLKVLPSSFVTLEKLKELVRYYIYWFIVSTILNLLYSIYSSQRIYINVYIAFKLYPINIHKNRLSRPIFYFNCEYFLFVHMVKHFIDSFLIVKNWILLEANFIDFINFITHKTLLGWCEVTQKIWARSIQPFIGYKQTDKKTPKQCIKM